MAVPSVITIGNFDGVHIAHQSLLQTARRLADQRRAQVIAMTFDPHPATILQPGSQPPRLMSRPHKIDALHDAGADRVIVLEPSEQILSLPPDTFVRKLVHEHHPVALVEGEGFRFGHKRAGDTALLQKLGQTHGFETLIIPPMQVALHDLLVAPVSSSLVRHLLMHGRVRDAARCLGRLYSLQAEVIHGERRGRTIGVPTANLDMNALAEYLIPAPGVYGGYVQLSHADPVPAAISVGIKPTFDHHPLLVEAHLLDYEGDLYGHTVSVRFARWLRDQQRFAGAAALQAQLQRDITAVRDWYNRRLLDVPAPVLVPSL